MKHIWYLITHIGYVKAQYLHYTFWSILTDKRPRVLHRNYLDRIAKFYCKNAGGSLKFWKNEVKKIKL